MIYTFFFEWYQYQQLELAYVQQQTVLFIFQDVKKDLEELQNYILQLRTLSNQMALYFCEEETTFDLQHCFQNLLDFCEAVKNAQRVFPFLI